MAILFIFPIIWASIFVWLRKTNFFRKRAPHPIAKPWDFVFGNDQSYWTIIEFIDGNKIGGMYDTKSFASSFPANEQIYLEELWEIDDNDGFIKPIKRSHGVIVSSKDIKSIRFYQ